MGDRHVEPGKDGWRVIKEGGARASATADTQAEAMERARQIIANDGGGYLVVHAGDGQIIDREPVEAATREDDRGEPGPDTQQPQAPRRVQDEVEERILDAGRTAASTAKQLADQGKDKARDVLGKVRSRLGR